MKKQAYVAPKRSERSETNCTPLARVLSYSSRRVTMKSGRYSSRRVTMNSVSLAVYYLLFLGFGGDFLKAANWGYCGFISTTNSALSVNGLAFESKLSALDGGH